MINPAISRNIFPPVAGKMKFEYRIENDEEVSSYGIYQDKEDNKISLFLLKVSQTCVRIIEYIVYIFSQIVSMLFNIMVY